MYPNTHLLKNSGRPLRGAGLSKTSFILLTLVFLACSIDAVAQASTHLNDQIIIKLKKEFASTKAFDKHYIGDQSLDAISNSMNALEITPVRFGKKCTQQYKLVQFPAGTNLEQAIAAYKKSGKIEYAVVNNQNFIQGAGVQTVLPNDSYYHLQWGLSNNGSFSLTDAKDGADIDMERAWDLSQGSPDIVVCVVDCGLKLDHPEFAERVWRNTEEIAGNNIDDDQNGYIDDVSGWDFTNNDNDPTDDNGHGTYVTSVVGANGNNGNLFAGVDWNCKLMITKALNHVRQGTLLGIANAIGYAVDNGADVINLSLVATDNDPLFHDAVNYALDNGVVVVAAMGNTANNTTYYPAAYDGVIAVGATNAYDLRASAYQDNPTYGGSCYGNHISVTAPGDFIYVLLHDNNIGGGAISGTSLAAPFVSGLASLLLAQDPHRTPTEIKTIIEASAEDQIGDPSEDIAGWDQYYGHGRINAYQALTYISSSTNEKTAQENSLRIYPIPSKGPVTIEFSETFNGTGTVYNQLGQEVHSFEMNSDRMDIDKSFSSGIYVLVLRSGTNSMSTQIIVE